MAVTFQFNSKAFLAQLDGMFGAYLDSAKADLKAEVAGEVERIKNRTIDLAALALAGDDMARKTLDDMWAQAALEAAIVGMREYDRFVATAKLIGSFALKTILAAVVIA